VRKILSMVFIFTILLVGCNSAKAIEDVFNTEMKTNKETNNYTIIKKVQEESYGIILFTSDKINNQVSIGYFEKYDNEWEWLKTTYCASDWSMDGESKGKPYIYCGTVFEPKFSKIFVGENEAEIIELEGSKRVWYYLSENLNEKIKAVLIDGSEEWIKNM